MSQNLKKENKMGTVPIKKLLLSMSLPAIFAMMVQALYNIVDSIYVSRVSEDALSAVTLSFPIQMIIVSLCVGGGVGINAVISRKLGEGKNKEANQVAEHGLLLMIALYLLILIFTFIFADQIFRNFTNNQTVISYGGTYIKIILFFSFGRLLAQAGMSILQGTGDMSHPMKTQLIGAISNIILDPILIFGWFGVPAMGVKGAAIATVIGQTLSMVYIFIVLYKKEHYIKINFRKFKFKGAVVKEICMVGIPAAIMQGIMSIMLFGMNIILASYNDLASTAFGVFYKVESLIILPILGLGQGVMPIIGYNYGAKNKDRISTTIKYGMIWSVSFMIFGVLIFQLFPSQLMAIFNSSSELTRIGIKAFRLISLSFPFVAATIIFSNVFQAMGKAIYSMFLSILRQLILLLPIAYLLGNLFGLDYLWYTYVISEGVGLIISLFLIKSIYKNDLNKKIHVKSDHMYVD